MDQFTTRQFSPATQSPTTQASLLGDPQSSKQVATTMLQPGDVLQDRYMILGILGAGGFSTVYRARDLRFQSVTRLCAIKEMDIGTADPQLRELTIKSFEREASVLAMLNHPAIPDIFDYFTEGNQSYLVLEFVPGQNLQQWLEETDESVDEQKALEWALQICEALAYLHSQKPQPIVFRDLKPSNIMLDQYNHIRLIDFGIAKVFKANEDKGTMIGTAGYTPPEQYRGEATPAVDVYGLGATLHHLLTRHDPRHETPFTFHERPIRAVNNGISRTFETIVTRCLAYDPKDRFPDAMALQEALLVLSQSTADETDVDQRASSSAGEVLARQLSTGATVRLGVSQIKPLWTFRCEDEVRSRAAVAKGIVFVGAYDHNLYAVTADKGELLWKFPTGGGIGASPTVHEDTVFITSSDHCLYALQMRKGRLTWRFSTEGAIYSSPNVRFDHVFFGSDDGYFYVVNALRGRLSWKTNVYSPVRSTSYVTDELAYFGTEGGTIYGLELTSGKIKWQSHVRHGLTSSPKVADDILFVGALDATVYAMDASSGWPIWRFKTQGAIVSTPTVYEGAVFIGSADGYLYAIDVNNGRQLWSYQTGGQIPSSPVVWDNAVYFSATDGSVYGLSLKRGELLWRFDTGSPVIASPTIHNGAMYIGAVDHTLYALPI